MAAGDPLPNVMGVSSNGSPITPTAVAAPPPRVVVVVVGAAGDVTVAMAEVPAG